MDLVLDLWAPLSHKEAMRGGPGARSALAPTWVGPHHRRLTAYKIFAGYLGNTSKDFLPATASEGERKNRREYGDPDLLVERVVAGVLGDHVELVVDGADQDLADAPDLPEEPQDPGPEASESERIVFDARLRVWREESAAAVTAWEQARTEVPRLRERQEWLRQWADDELLEQKLYEGEKEGAVALGDAVYALGWSPAARRPVIKVYDPGWYFPVLDDDDRGYPRKVHVAWEFEETLDDGTKRRFVRRITWELVRLSEVVTPDGVGVASRRYPWQEQGEKPSEWTCVMTDATWAVEHLGTRKVNDFDERAARYARNEDGVEVNRLDLLIDFIPVVHVPNTPSSKEHFGRSVLSRVLQLLDDVQSTDTDVQTAAGLTALPLISGPGISADGKVRVKAGAAINLRDGGRMDVLDMAGSLEALRLLADDLLDRLSVNAQVPAEVLGRVKASEVPSGFAFLVGTGPFNQLIGVLRLTREPKGRLILKFVQRLAQAGKALPAGPVPPARIAFGSFLPSDLARTVDLVVALLGVHGISRTTALRMLVDAGLDIGDAAEELAAIAAEDHEGASQLADALGDEGPAYEYLGLERPEQPDAPVLPLIVPPGQ